MTDARRSTDSVTHRELRDAMADVDEQFDELRVGQLTLDAIVARLVPAVAAVLEAQLAPIRERLDEALGPTLPGRKL